MCRNMADKRGAVCLLLTYLVCYIMPAQGKVWRLCGHPFLHTHSVVGTSFLSSTQYAYLLRTYTTGITCHFFNLLWEPYIKAELQDNWYSLFGNKFWKMGSAEKKKREEKLGCRSRPKPGFLGGPEAVCFVRLLPKTAAPDLTPTLIAFWFF